MVRAPRSPEKLALSKARRDAADVSVVMADKETVLMMYEYRSGNVHVLLKATHTIWANKAETFTLETKNTLWNQHHSAGDWTSVGELMDRAHAIERSYKADVMIHMNSEAANAQK